MKKIFKVLATITLVALIGFSFAACDGGDGGTGGVGGGGTESGTPGPVTGVTLNQNDISLSEGGTATLTATVTPGNAKNKTVTWSTSDEAKATVSTNGVVTAVATGSAVITVTTADGNFTDTCTVSVLPSIIPPGTTVTKLTENVWADGNLPTSSAEQWFKFTATASTQYIHFNPDTLTRLYVQLYDSSGETVAYFNLPSGSGSSSKNYITRSVTGGQEYYIKASGSSSGSYQIGFTKTIYPPTPTLTENVWADGNLPASSDEQWFMFTATASTQYIHFNPGTLTSLNVQLYNSSGDTVGSQTSLSDYTKYITRSVTEGQEYYIKARPYNSTASGTYRIGFNKTFLTPGTAITTLTENVWADGNLPASSDVQWFKFTATASTQCIHFNPGTLTGLSSNVYNSSGAMVRFDYNRNNYNSKNYYISTTVTNGQEYYIQVRPSGSSGGSYQIGFNTSIFPCGTTLTKLTEGIWADGNLPTSSDEQLFMFTATASTQYLHFNLGTLTSLDIMLYDSNGDIIYFFDSSAHVEYGNESLNSSKYISLKVTNGKEHYIRASGYPNSGSYQIALNKSSTPPPVTLPTGETQLTLNTWADGNDVQWFKFTATATSQYIHVSFGTLSSVYVQVYDSSGVKVGNLSNLYGSTKNKFLSGVTVGQEYYFKVLPYRFDSGTYRIAFNTSSTAPN